MAILNIIGLFIPLEIEITLSNLELVLCSKILLTKFLP